MTAFALDCVIWQGCLAAGGYGRRWWNGRSSQQAHRVAYEQEYGEIGADRHIHHLCGVRACVNPDHLISVSPADHVVLFGARRAKATHCKRGHPRTPDNLIGNHCRTCRAEVSSTPEQKARKSEYDKGYRVAYAANPANRDRRNALRRERRAQARLLAGART